MRKRQVIKQFGLGEKEVLYFRQALEYRHEVTGKKLYIDDIDIMLCDIFSGAEEIFGISMRSETKEDF